MGADLETIGSQWAPLLELCGDGALFQAKTDAVSAWSVGEQLEHTAIALNLIGDAITNMLANPDQDADHEANELGQAVLEGGAIPRGRGKAPDFLLPQGESVPANVNAELLQAKEKWDALSEKSEEIDACPATFAHFALGAFTPAQWARFTAVHTDHHIKIIRDVIEGAGHASPV